MRFPWSRAAGAVVVARTARRFFASHLLHALQRHKYNTVTEIGVKQERAKGLMPES